MRSQTYAASSARASVVADVAAAPRAARALRAWNGTGSTDRARPCTSCSSCTANSMSRIPPRPALHLAVRQALAAQHLFRARLHRARFADRAGVERVGPHERARPRSTNASPSAASTRRPASALMSACSSQFCAHRSQYASKPSSVRLSAPDRPSGRSVGVGAEHDPVRRSAGSSSSARRVRTRRPRTDRLRARTSRRRRSSS